MTALSIMRLVPDPPGRIVGGSVALEGTDLLALDEDEMRAIRGNRISMIFQEPMTSLNPVMRIGDQIAEAVRLHRNDDRQGSLEAGASRCCAWSGFPSPSGGRRNIRTSCPAACASAR